MMPLKLNQVYPIFDNGIIEKSRRNYVKIVKIELFEDADAKIKQLWLNAKDSDLYAENIDFFIYGVDFQNRRHYIFASTKDRGYFSFNNFLFDSRLDFDGSLNSKIFEK
jgi:hypothetical protein